MVATTLLTLLVITEAGGGALRAGIRRISDSPTLQCNCKCTSPGFQPGTRVRQYRMDRSQTFLITDLFDTRVVSTMVLAGTFI